MKTSAPDSGPTARLARSPMTVFVVAATLGAVVLAWSIVESVAVNRQLQAVVDASGSSLVETTGHAIEDAVRSSFEIEELASARLLDLARMIDRLDRKEPLDRDALNELSDRLELHRIVLVDGDLRTYHADDAGCSPEECIAPFLTPLRDMLGAGADVATLGPPAGTGTPDPLRFAAAIRRPTGGAVLVVMEAQELLAFQAEIGIDHLLDELAETPGIVYVALDGPDGAPMAGRRPDAAGVDVREITHDVVLGYERTGVLRVGLDTAHVALEQRAARRRIAVLGVVLLGLALALAIAALARQRTMLLRGRAERAQVTADTVLTSMVDAVVLLDRDGVVRRVNPATEALLGQPADTLVGRRCEESACAGLEDIVGEERTVREGKLRLSSGASVPVLVSVSPIRFPLAREAGRAVLIRDMRPIRELEEASRRAENLAAMGRMAGEVAHEVRNPLNAIGVSAQRLRKEFTPTNEPADYRRLTGLLRDEVERLDRIVEGFLNFARVPAVDPQPSDLDALVRDTVSLLQAGEDAANRTIEVGLGDPPRVRFDDAALRQIILNLVRNAREACGPEGSIRVTTSWSDGHATLCVADDGPGIPPEERRRLFEFGYTTKDGGTGMGLPIVYRLVEQMNGSIEVESGPGTGTNFRVTLPLEPALETAR